jgi:superfamily II DNA or RNA helicase
MKNPEVLESVMPGNFKYIDYKGHNVAVRHRIDEVKVLNNLGINAPSPILHHYDWPGKFTAWDHQKQTAALLTMHRRAFVLNEAGTAKTASALWAADYLMTVGKIRKVLVVAKLSTLERVWMEEIFNVLMKHRTASLVYGSRDRRIAALGKDADFYVVNHEGVGVVIDALRARKDIDLIILDEASDYRNASNQKYKLLYSLLTPDMRIWPLTATPCPNAPTDAWALARLVDPSKVPKYFGHFRRMTMNEGAMYKWTPKPGAFEMAYDVLQPGVRYIKSDCLDLPPVVTEERTCQLSSEQIKMFKAMKNEQQMVAAKVMITAVNAADVINKLRQMLCGSVKEPETGKYVDVDYNDRFKVLLECLQEANAKALVIVPFKGIVGSLKRRLEKHYSCEILNGGVKMKERGEIITRFKTTKNPHVLLCHPQVMAHGLNLTEADTLIFYAPIYSNDEFMQVQERFNRAGQTRKMTIYRMGGHPVEWAIYKMLDKKQEGQERILGMYRDTFS